MEKPKSNKQKRELLKRKEEEKKLRLKELEARKLKREREARVVAVAVLAKSKIGTRNPKEAIRVLYEGEDVYIATSSPLHTVKTMFSEFRNETRQPHPEIDEVRKALFDLLMHCEDQGVSFRNYHQTNFARAVTAVAKNHKSWLRPVQEWKPTSYNDRKQFSSLIRHLFAKYPVPLFMDSAWFSTENKHQGWFKHIGEGANIRTASGLPIPLTKMMAHHFLQAPDDFDIPAAIRWGQIHAMGGDERLVRASLRTRIGTAFTSEDFWTTVFQ